MSMDTRRMELKSHNVCPSCRNLEYDLYDDIVPRDAHARKELLPHELPTAVHFHAVEFDSLTASAEGGCQYCYLLHQGISLFRQKDLDEWLHEGYKPPDNKNDAENSSGWIIIRIKPGMPLTLFRNSGPAPDRGWWMHSPLEFYTEPGYIPIHPSFGQSGNVPPDLDLTTCTKLVQRWLHDCQNQHEGCARGPCVSPTRLIHIEGKQVTLVNMGEMSVARYTTLSHCWGDDTKMIKTTKDNIRQHMSGISWDELPLLFQDAIALTRNIGCEWIWMDSLCIIQDDERDWKRESARMSDVYSNSFLNIAATFLNTSLKSCFSTRICPGYHQDNGWPLDTFELVSPLGDRKAALRLRVRVEHNFPHSYITSNGILGRKRHAPLLDRAWVFQERLLAPRCLHFGISELHWECNSTTSCECTSRNSAVSRKSLKNKLALVTQGRASQQYSLDLWLEMIDAYSSLALTKLSDRPYALAGLVSCFNDALECHYMDGLWSADLPRALSWTSIPRSSSIKLRPPGFVPSWSWMSQYTPGSNDCKCSYWVVDFQKDDRLTIHDGGTFAENDFDNVDHKQIRLSGAVRCGKTIFDSLGKISLGRDYYVQISPDHSSPALLWADCPVADGIYDGEDVLLLLLGTKRDPATHSARELKGVQVILVLRPLLGATQATRIGIVKLSWWRSDGPETEDWFNGIEAQHITII